jgi:hypothetical protein
MDEMRWMLINEVKVPNEYLFIDCVKEKTCYVDDSLLHLCGLWYKKSVCFPQLSFWPH